MLLLWLSATSDADTNDSFLRRVVLLVIRLVDKVLSDDGWRPVVLRVIDIVEKVLFAPSWVSLLRLAALVVFLLVGLWIWCRRRGS